MKNKSSESITKLNQFADVLMVKKALSMQWEISNGKEMKKKPFTFELIGKFKTLFFFIFHRNQRLQNA